MRIATIAVFIVKIPRRFGQNSDFKKQRVVLFSDATKKTETGYKILQTSKDCYAAWFR